MEEYSIGELRDLTRQYYPDAKLAGRGITKESLYERLVSDGYVSRPGYDTSRNGVDTEFIYIWQPVIRINKLITNDKVYRTKRDAMQVAINALNNFKNPDTTYLIKKLNQLNPDNMDNISFTEGNYAVSLNKLTFYLKSLATR